MRLISKLTPRFHDPEVLLPVETDLGLFSLQLREDQIRFSEKTVHISDIHSVLGNFEKLVTF